MIKTFTLKTISIFVLILLSTVKFSYGQDRQIPKQSEELGIFEHLDSTLTDDLKFTDENNKEVYLKDLITKPTVINLVYYECPGICTPLINGLSDVIKQSDIVLGTEYQIVTVSFDAGETYKLARKKKNTYKKINSSDDVEHGWKFLTGDQENINKLLNELGFKVKKDGEEFIHPAALMIVSPERKITRYLNGTYFNPFDFKLALVEASEGRSGPTINKVLNYCFSYDPAGKKYVFNITKVAGSIVIFFAALLLFFMLIAERRRKKSIEAKS
jgi:protein SCO1/2